MSNEFKREERYIVFKVSDLGNSLKGDEIRKLAQEYAEHRKQRGKEPLECVVVEKDWPEYEPTWKAIEARITGAQQAPEKWIQRGIAELEAIRSHQDDAVWFDDRLLIERIGKAMLAAAPEDKPTPSEQDGSVRKAWVRFSNELHHSPDELYPGMAEAFEHHFSQPFKDGEWHVASRTWAAAWKAAKHHARAGVPDDTWLPVPDKHPTFDPVDLRLADGSVLCGCLPQSDGDYWWKGPSGEVFIDPRYAPVTHWRLSAAPEDNP